MLSKSVSEIFRDFSADQNIGSSRRNKTRLALNHASSAMGFQSLLKFPSDKLREARKPLARHLDGLRISVKTRRNYQNYYTRFIQWCEDEGCLPVILIRILTQSWLALTHPLRDVSSGRKGHRDALRKLGYWCTMNKIEPVDLNTEYLNEYVNHLKNESGIASWPQIYHRTRREWQYHEKNGDVHHLIWPKLPNGKRSNYALMLKDWPERLQAIYAVYRKYCTDLFVESRHHRHRQNQNSADKNLSLIEQLFGFAYRIQKVPIDSLSLDLLFDKTFIYAYYDWMAKDRLGRVTRTLETVAGRLLGMANGFFKRPDAVPWLQQLKIEVSGATVRDIKEMALTMKELNAVADGIRDQGIRELEKAKNSGRIPSKKRQARLKMFELMTRLFIHRLLRRSNVCEMRIEKNLIKTDDGHYLIRFGAGEMKSRKEYKSSFPSSLVPLLEEFLEDHRPFLCEGFETDYLFPAPTLGHISGDSTLNFLRRHSLRIVGKPLTPHLIRHSVSIEFLRNNPGQSLTLSTMLHHSTEKLTIDLYAHFDGLVAAEIFDKIMEDDDEETKAA